MTADKTTPKDVTSALQGLPVDKIIGKQLEVTIEAQAMVEKVALKILLRNTV